MSSALERFEWLRQALDTSPTAVVVVDAQGHIVFVNAELEQLFGYGRDELVGRAIEMLVPEPLRLRHASDREGFAAAPAARLMGVGRELRGRLRSGEEIPIEVGLSPMANDGEPLVLASIVDIRERLRLETARRAALQDQVAFEHLIAQFSLRSINLGEEQFHGEIRDLLQTLGSRLSLDRSWYFRLGAGDAIIQSILWTDTAAGRIEMPQAPQELFPWGVGELRAGRTVVFASRDGIPDERDRAGFARVGVESGVYVPVMVDGRLAAALGFASLTAPRTWPPEVVHRLEVVGNAVGQVLATRAREEALRNAHAEVQQLKDQLQAENVYLRREERERLGVTRIVGHGAAIARVMQQVHQVAATDSTVLLLGETGTGKELFAAQIHELSARHTRAMVRVNCAAIPGTLIESELFGREKGAFTGALTRQVGRFELAHRSTIFLDEIGDLPQDVQVKLLRVLEERTIERLGSPRSIAIDTRVIAATHRDLEARVRQGQFREDLYYRLNVFPIAVPPLRERSEDIPLLVWRFIEEFSKAFGKRIDAVDKDSLAALQHYEWPGNVRELRNTVERAMIVASGRRLSIPVPSSPSAPARRSTKLADVEREHIRNVLETTRWRVRGAAGAADRLGLKPTTLETRMARLGIRRPKPS